MAQISMVKSEKACWNLRKVWELWSYVYEGPNKKLYYTVIPQKGLQNWNYGGFITLNVTRWLGRASIYIFYYITIQ